MKFKLVEDFNKITENFKTFCPSCEKEVIPDYDFYCPNCSSTNLLDNVISDILQPDSNFVIIFNDNGTIGKADKRLIANGHEIDRPDAPVLAVTKDFWDSIQTTVHDRTRINDKKGAFKLDNLTRREKILINALKNQL